MSAICLPAATLWKRELVRFARDRNRMFGAILQPVILWFLVGYGLDASFLPAGYPESMRYLEYIYPGTLLLILLFTAIFSTITVVEDRKEGFMQSVLVAPVSRMGLVLGKILGGTTLALLEGIVFLVFLFWLNFEVSPIALASTVGFLALISFALTGLGFTIAWRMESTAGFHAIMNVFLMPMWLLSGSFFPPTGVPSWLGWVMTLNPLTYGMAGLRQVLYLETGLEGAGLPGMGLCVGITALFAVLTLGTSVLVVRRRDGGRI